MSKFSILFRILKAEIINNATPNAMANPKDDRHVLPYAPSNVLCRALNSTISALVNWDESSRVALKAI
ncbi:unnamed protein product [Rhizophagus irregularis]|nr:unnamed protein product [Rhizophagus irregularis]CAB5358724.1 unnamed protein product [Rhizophagus irregularis]